MKRQIIIAIALMIFMPLGTYAHGSESSSQSSSTVSSDETVNKILADQDVSSVGELNCDDVSQADYEELGEAMMSFMHPDEEEHEAMDAAMGGEGSELLEAMHLHMGERFLGCDEGMIGPMMMGGMMDGTMMGQSTLNDGRSTSMMGGATSGMFGGMNPFGYGSYGIIQLLIWLLAIFGLVALVKFLVEKTKK